MDAKSIYDSLSVGTTASKSDRRTAIELAILQHSFSIRGTSVRWVPHPMNPADIMVKPDVSRGNHALSHLIKTGRIQLLEGTSQEWNHARDLGRSKSSSRQLLESRSRESRE